jgi:hypothetical protein
VTIAVLPDPEVSQALLVGVAQYRTLQNLPTVQNNLTALQKELSDPAVWGLSTENGKVLRQPDSADYVLNSLQDAATVATDALVFYFAGHGLIDPGNDDELYLALPGSDIERAYRTAVPYGWVRREMQVAQARRKIVILDCCYSGRALGQWMGDGKGDVAGHLEIEGACVLTATARTRRALAPPDEQFTAFTGELIAILAEGIPEGPDLLDMETLFRQLRIRMRTRGLPLPQRAQQNQGGHIALARNRASVARSHHTVTGRFETVSKKPMPDSEVPSPSAPEHEASEKSTSDYEAPRLLSASERENILNLSIKDIASPREAASTRTPFTRTPGRKVSRREPVGPPEAVSVVALLGWILIAALLAYVCQPRPWLIAAGAAGFISLVAVRHDALVFKGSFFAIPCLGAYINACVKINDWLVLAWVAVTLLLYVSAMLMRFFRFLDTY